MFFFHEQETYIYSNIKTLLKILRDNNGYLRVGFFNIHTLLIIHQVWNLDVHKLSIEF